MVRPAGNSVKLLDTGPGLEPERLGPGPKFEARVQGSAGNTIAISKRGFYRNVICTEGDTNTLPPPQEGPSEYAVHIRSGAHGYRFDYSTRYHYEITSLLYMYFTH